MVATTMTLEFKSPVTLLTAEEDRAVIEEHYEYLNCCADGAGWYIMGYSFTSPCSRSGGAGDTDCRCRSCHLCPVDQGSVLLICSVKVAAADGRVREGRAGPRPPGWPDNRWL